MVRRSTPGRPGPRLNRACNSRAVVLLPTATLPPIPITNGAAGRSSPRNPSVRCWRSRAAAARRAKSWASGSVHLGHLVDGDRFAGSSEHGDIRRRQSVVHRVSERGPATTREGLETHVHSRGGLHSRAEGRGEPSTNAIANGLSADRPDPTGPSGRPVPHPLWPGQDRPERRGSTLGWQTARRYATHRTAARIGPRNGTPR